MAVPTTAVTFSSIQTEFGGSTPISMSEYIRGAATAYVPSNQDTSAVDGRSIPTTAINLAVGMFRGLTKTVVQTFQYSLTAPTYYWQDPYWANGISPSNLFWNGAFITAAITAGSTTYTSGAFTYTRGTAQGSSSSGTTFLGGVGTVTKAFTYYSVSRA
jgi:hypothetical protein